MKRKRFLPINVFNFLLQEERRSGILLILSALLALILANSAWASSYFSVINSQHSVAGITLSLQHWISEGLMALFFLVVVLEVKREFICGELRTWRKASFPLFAAVGGMLAPALIYSLLNPSPPAGSGWAIPIATDIAIALGVLALLGKRVPKSLRVFLLALAIIDDIGSIIIIGLFYSQPTNSIALVSAITLTLLLIIFRKYRTWPIPFFVIGLLLWYCLLLSGISGTMAGVIIAALMPIESKGKRSRQLTTDAKIEDILLPVTAYIIVPLFVLTSAGLSFGSVSLGDSTAWPVFLGVLAGLFIGKPLGIVALGWISSQLRLTNKPTELSWRDIIGVGFIAGIGFTVSLLILGLAFNNNPDLYSAALIGVFLGSILAGTTGLLLLSSKKPT